MIPKPRPKAQDSKNGKRDLEATHGTRTEAFCVVSEDKLVGRLGVVKVTVLIWMKRNPGPRLIQTCSITLF